MEYQFSFGSFIIGLLITIVGIIFTKWHQKIADNFASGAASYDQFKLAGLGICILGLIVSINLHYFILYNLISILFPQIK